jgi:UDP-N-acetylmuramate--alanine ligase
MKHKVKKIHFIGIGGVGMSGIAEVLLNLGYQISGSDMVANYNSDRLQQLGVLIYIGHAPGNVGTADVIVTSSAISQANPEIKYGLEQHIPIVPRAQMLAELMRFKYGIAIAGTHGKTTTTSLAAEVLKECGFDPTFIIGGKLATTGSNAKLGLGEYLLAEADESDASFLFLNPMIAVVTNIDLDHMETYAHDEDKLKQAFVEFLRRIPFYGRAIICGEDKRVQEILPQINRPVYTYGLNSSYDLYADNIQAQGSTMQFMLQVKWLNLSYPCVVNMPGVHNVLNSLAVIALALECNGKIEDIARGLANFHGVGRRCQHYPPLNYANKSATLVDDYGHHPAEIRATVQALKNAYPQKRMIVVFQPHRYTRTKDLFDDFVAVLSTVDYVIVCEVYAAGERPIALADGRALVRAIRLLGNENITFAEDINDAMLKLFSLLHDNDLVVTMGAGSVGKLPELLLKNSTMFQGE